MLGGYISDLEAGDVFKPVEYVLTPFMCSEYAHGVETDQEWFHSALAPGGKQLRLPTMIHVDKMRLLEANCHKEQRVSAGGRISTAPGGPDARIHYEYHAHQHSAACAGERLVVSGRITDADAAAFVVKHGKGSKIYDVSGREYIDYYLEVRTSDGRLVTTYTDKTLLKYRPEGGSKP